MLLLLSAIYNYNVFYLTSSLVFSEVFKIELLYYLFLISIYCLSQQFPVFLLIHNICYISRNHKLAYIYNNLFLLVYYKTHQILIPISHFPLPIIALIDKNNLSIANVSISELFLYIFLI